MDLRTRNRGLWSLAGVLVLVAAWDAGPSSTLVRAQPPKVVNNDSVRLQEGQYLVQAYSAVIMANHDYGGHRGKAAHAIREGLWILHEQVMRHATADQQAVVSQQHGSVVAADEASKHSSSAHEGQAASDAQLAQAQQLLLQLRPTLVTNNQQHIVAHVDRALREIQLALLVH
jgi:hypothetical protein